VRSAIEQVLADRRLAKTRPTFVEGGIDAATHQYESSPSADLLIIESRDPPDAIFQQLEHLSQVCRVETNLILIGAYNDVALYRTLTKQGVREYLPIPVDPQHLLESVVSVCADPQDLKQGRLISFIGATGGTGSTTMANNVSWCLGKLFDAEAILIDLDLAFGTVSIDFNLESPETSAQALAQADRLDDQLLARIVGKYNDNLGVLTAPADCARTADIDIQMLEEMLTRLRHNAAWVTVDLPHYWGGWVRQVLDLSDEIVLTAVPTLASLRNAKSAVDLLNAKRKNDAPVRVVLNRIGQNAKIEITAKDFASTLGSALTVTIPHEPAIFGQAANTGHMVGEAPRAKGVIEPLNTLASLVSGRQGAAPRGAAAKQASLLDKLLPGAKGKIPARVKA
jgi:pilus assembly protein CpaE